MKLYDAGFTFVWRHRINVSKLTSRTMLMALDLPTFDFGVIHTSGALITNFHVCNVDVCKSDFRQFIQYLGTSNGGVFDHALSDLSLQLVQTLPNAAICCQV